MADKKIYIGSFGPFLYDDGNAISDPDGDFIGLDQRGLATNGDVYVGGDQKVVGDLVIDGTLSITGDLSLTGNFVVADGKWVGQTAGPKILFNDSDNHLEISDGNVEIVYSTSDPVLRVQQDGAGDILVLYDGASLAVRFIDGGYVILTNIKSGATQVAAGAAAGELWKTSSHASLPDDVIMIGV